MEVKRKHNPQGGCDVTISIDEFNELHKTGVALKTLDARLRHIFNTLDNSFWGADMVNHKMLYVSPGNEKVYGYTEEEFLNNPNLWYEVIVSEDKYIADGLFPQVAKGNKAIGEYRIIHKDGSIRWVEARLTPTLDEYGNLILLDGITFDITKRKQAESKLLEGKNRFKNLIESIKGVYWVNNPETKQKLYVSPSFEKIWGRSTEELYQDPSAFIKSIHPEDRERVFEIYSNIADYTSTEIEYRIIRPDGDIRWISARIYISRDETGCKTEYGYAEDVTERKRSEKLLEQREWKLNEAQKLSKTGSFEFNLDTSELRWSKEHYRIFEMEETPADKLWEECRKKIHPEDISKLEDAISLARKDGKTVNIEHRIICKDGSIKYLFGIAGIYKDENDQANILRGSVQDITEIKKSEQQLRQSEYHLRTIVQTEPECVKVVNQKGQLVEINPAGLAMLEAEDINQIRDREVIHLIKPAYKTAFINLSNDVFNGKSARLEFEIVGLKGTHRWLETHAVPLRDETEKIYALLSVTRDITERKKTEEKLKLNEHRLQEAQKVARMGDYSYSFETGVWKCSSVVDEITGLDPEAIMVFDNWIKLLTPDVRAEIVNKIIPLINKGTLPDGHYLDCKIKRASDGEERWVTIVGELEHDSSGKPIRLKGTVQDITERKNSEEEIKRLNESLERKVDERTAELKLANNELEAFNYSVSHDLQTPLRSLSGFSSILVNDYSDRLDDLGKEYLHIINRTAIRMSSLVNELLHFSKSGKSPVSKSDVDMNKLVGGIISDIKLHNKTVSAEFITATLASAYGDAALLRQVWENLISNSVKYSSKTNKPQIIIGMRQIGDESVYFIQDNGAGFDMKTADKLFNVFSRMHSSDEFEGNGVGLAIVERIIAKHGGRIWAESEVNKGAVFYFTIPAKS